MSAQLIGRFEILRELGKGGQGAVYLARDPQLDRQVAIKTLRNLAHKTEQLIHEARIVSKLQQPNIVPLYDFGEHQGTPYLVYAHIEGRTLEQLLKENKNLSLVQAAEIASGVLAGLAYAHAQGISHLDVKPANVMITADNTPMLMDFGLATASGKQPQDFSATLSGTPRYMAPELIAGKPVAFSGDLYAAGVMLYEMVTGEFAVSGENIYEVLNRAANESIASPSSHNELIDEKLEAIILKSVAKDPSQRYPDAEAMRQALQDYLGEKNKAEPTQHEAHSTLEFLLRRMRSKSDFPALSNIISEINKIVSSESESTSKLARTILQDFALTNKLLKLVNTASYGQFGGTINTVSKAVVILGFETVRNIAMTLILLEFLQNKAQASQLRDEIIKAVFSGIVAAQLSGHNIRDAEEVMVCSMFHNLGKMLATFYFFDESQEISRLVERGETEQSAAQKVLGVNYPELGLGVAHNWNFPPRLLAGMHKLAGDRIAVPHGELDELTVTVNLAHDLCDVAVSAPLNEKSQALRALSKRYENAHKVSERELSGALDNGLGELKLRAGILGINTTRSLLLDKVRLWCGQAESSLPKEKKQDTDGVTGLEQVTIAPPELVDGGDRNANAEAILSAGIQDVTTSLVSDFNLNDLLQMILETIYRGMGFNRAMIMIRDNKKNIMAARFGFGADIEATIPRLRFSLSFVPDVFHLSIAKGLDIAIEDIHAPNISDKIPEWYRSSVNAPSFMLLPVMVKEKPIALFYADMPTANGLNMSPQQLSLLRTLRNQAVLAIKQKV
ncbi:MAG: HDOD domain-containing protein [Nitrosomonadales bacterium]|nr:HDOD domain-containing protein [Nitrosomonadales bacterium]